MLKRRVLRQVQGILADRQIETLRPSFDVDRLLVQTPECAKGSAAVLVSVQEYEGRPVVVLCANLLEDVAVERSQRAMLLEVVNRLNGHTVFGRLWYDEPAAAIRFEHVLPAADLDDDELIWPLLHLGEMADELDDQLLGIVTRGRRARDLLALAAERRSVADDAFLNPVLPPPIP